MNGASVELKQCCSEGWRSSEGNPAIVQLVAWCFQQWTTYLVLSGGLQAVLSGSFCGHRGDDGLKRTVRGCKGAEHKWALNWSACGYRSEEMVILNLATRAGIPR